VALAWFDSTEANGTAEVFQFTWHIHTRMCREKQLAFSIHRHTKWH
jgi:hypothetical protein